MVLGDQRGIHQAIGQERQVEGVDVKQGYAEFLGGDFRQALAVHAFFLHQILDVGHALQRGVFLRLRCSLGFDQPLRHQPPGQPAELPYRFFIHLRHAPTAGANTR